jgi:hypothetical protein
LRTVAKTEEVEGLGFFFGIFPGNGYKIAQMRDL